MFVGMERLWESGVCRRGGRGLSILAIALLCCGVALPASGQIPVSGGNQSASVILQRGDVLTRANDAFVEELDYRVRRDRDKFPKGWLSRAEERSAELQSRFSERAERVVNRLRGDGVLQADEVASELGELRSDLLSEFSIALSAYKVGKEAPPSRQNFESILAYSRAMLEYTFTQRNGPIDFLAIVAAVLIGLTIAWVISRAAAAAAERLSARGQAAGADIVRAFRAPLYLAAASTGLSVGLSRFWVPGAAEAFAGEFTRIIFLIGVFWLLWNLCDVAGRLLGWAIRRTYMRTIDDHALLVIRRLLKVAVASAFFALMVQMLLDADLASVLAGLGIIGVALYLILKGTLENVAAAFTIFGDRPFRVGDLVIYDGEWGHVEDIGFRSTKIRTLQDHLITVPNAVLVDESIHNVGARGKIRRRFHIDLPYDTKPAKVREAIDILRDILSESQDETDAYKPHVVFESYGAHSLRLLVQYFFGPPDYWKALEHDTEINLQILERFNESEIEFAFPTETHILQTEADAEPAIRFMGDRDPEESRAAAGADTDGTRPDDPAANRHDDSASR